MTLFFIIIGVWAAFVFNYFSISTGLWFWIIIWIFILRLIFSKKDEIENQIIKVRYDDYQKTKFEDILEIKWIYLRRYSLIDNKLVNNTATCYQKSGWIVEYTYDNTNMSSEEIEKYIKQDFYPSIPVWFENWRISIFKHGVVQRWVFEWGRYNQIYKNMSDSKLLATIIEKEINEVERILNSKNDDAVAIWSLILQILVAYIDANKRN